MHGIIKDWKNGWFGVELGFDLDEIDALIELLQMIKKDPEQHFHMSSEHRGDGGLGDIEVFVRSKSEEHNMRLSSLAMAPGDEIDA